MHEKIPGMDDIRRRAEEFVDSETDPSTQCSGEDVHRLIHELRVHQVELEMQNEELRSAHARLEESRMRYVDLYDFAPVGYFIFDEQGRIVEVNLTGARQLGIERGKLMKLPFSIKVVEGDRKEFLSHLQVVFATQEGASCEVRLARNGGGEFYARLDSIFIPDGQGAGFCRTSVTDISEKKRAQEALQRAHDELERRVEERTAELASELALRKRAQEELRIYAEKLERSNKELQEFAFVASHDMQEPLRKVQSFGNILVEQHGSALNEQGKDYLKRMMSATKRMSQMIESLLTYSRVATRAEEFRKVDLSRVVEEVVDDLGWAIERSGGRVEVGELCEVEADRTQIDQLLQNLIANAIKFHGPEPPLIRIRTELDDGGGVEGAGQCRIYVEDNGIGFDETYLDRIFTLFQRLHGRSEYEGTGMGLAICRKIVERHGGAITAQSKPGEGSTFIITLPRKQLKSDD